MNPRFHQALGLTQIPQVVMNIDIVTPLYQSLTKTSPHAFLRLGLFYAKPSLQKKISIQSRSFHFISGGRHILLNKPFLITSSVDFCRFLKHFRVKIRRPMHGALLHLSRACPTMRILYAPVAPRWGITHLPKTKYHMPGLERGKQGRAGLELTELVSFCFSF